MNLFLYFCIPLVVTGQATSGILGRRNQNQKLTRGYASTEDNAETSETEAYSKYAFGGDVAYRNAVLANLAAEGRRRPVVEDSGSVGRPRIYQNQATSGTNENPSVVSADIYNNIKMKKINGNNNPTHQHPRGAQQHQQEPSPLAYDAHDQNNVALLTAQHQEAVQPVIQLPTEEDGTPLKSHLPPVVPVEQQLVPVQDPRTGEIFYRNLIPLYGSPVAPKVELQYQYPPQHLAPTKVLAEEPQQEILAAPPTKVLADPYNGVLEAPPSKVLIAHPHQTLLKAHPPTKVVAHPHHHGYYTYAAPPGKVLADPNYEVLQEQVPVQPVHTKAVAPVAYDPALLKTHAYAPAHTLLKSPEQLYQYQTPLLKEAPSPVLLKSPVAPVYQYPQQQPVVLKEAQHLTPVEAPVYQTPLIKSAQPTLLKAAPHPSYLTQLLYSNGAPVALQGYPAYEESPALYKTLDPALYKTAAAPVLKEGAVPLLKPTPDYEARIVPAIEEHVSGLEQYLSAAPVKTKLVSNQHHPQVTHVLLNPKNPKGFVQKAILKDPPVYTEKAVLKAAFSPALTAYQGHGGVFQQAVAKVPATTQYVQSSHSHVEPGLPSTILKSQKTLVKALITADQPYKQHTPGGKTVLELVPSVSYGQQSYSLYPKANGLYGPPQPFHGYGDYRRRRRTHNHHHHHHNHRHH